MVLKLRFVPSKSSGLTTIFESGLGLEAIGLLNQRASHCLCLRVKKANTKELYYSKHKFLPVQKTFFF